MKTTLRSLALVSGGCLGLWVWTDAALSQGFYVNGGVGAAIAEDVDLRKFVTRTPGARIELDPGARLSVAGGYNFNDYLGVQAETGFIYNNIKDITGTGGVDGSLAHSPLLVSAVVRYDQPNCNWVFFGGVGAGGDASLIYFDHTRGPNGFPVDGEDSRLVFAWQAFGGVRYKFARNMSIGASYKFFYADGASYDVGYTSGDIKTDAARIHCVLVDFNFKF